MDQEPAQTFCSCVATPLDYMIQTYFQVRNITSGPQYEMYKRRFNNIIFNHLSEIVQNLTITIYFPRCQELLRNDLGTVRYMSCICPHTITSHFYPVFVQHFDPKHGIKHRLLDFTKRDSGFSSILINFGVIERIVGFCGDYCYHDPGNPTPSNHLQSLRTLGQRNVLNLPYSDDFVPTLFSFLIDYLPIDLISALDKLGHVCGNNSGQSQLVRNLVSEYIKWKEGQEHVLLSSYTSFVISNLGALNAYLERFKCLPYSVGALFTSVLNRFLLVFTNEIYREVDAIKMSDNSAVMYYFYLTKLRDLFTCYEDSGYVPTKASAFLDSEIEHLVDNLVIDSKDQAKIDEFHKEFTEIVDSFYTRAKIYIKNLLSQFPNFDKFAWIVLPVAEYSQVHETYHLLHESETTCHNCQQLLLEVRNINIVLANLPLLEIESVVEKWLLVLKEGDFPMIAEMLEYLFSLPASYKVMEDLVAVSGNECKTRVVNKNIGNIEVGAIGDVFANDWGVIEDIIKSHQISVLED
ncbi:uncharacterized protein LOC657575 isoform X1 [Tribolium castaneum]|uniref:Uncharacterized protein n=1 Tax=Tribolium castaneum TaxID=7070 RepID=D2A5W5_TRICA|nr:PREDICTED: uncharacterized protein LOC107397402 [Tribolium castaneum]XP_015836382.1 PREDICTED: uncharacterized protein LOC107397402 [Tribolium castaneum]EFA05015.1 hypothetical protein TcasGA2_TC015097 [Tribolium castaneum]|eukprot:XP_008194724.1 PREDICTED: uncharacterized protein LOC107397402 [Tribolium castaneum]